MGSVPIGAHARSDFSAGQLKLIRRTVARSCSDVEFDEFIAAAAQCGLDPLRRHIAPLVLNAEDPERRRMIPWTTIDGLRVIAARQGDYRPMETAPKLELDAERIDSDRNPLGLVRAEVSAWKYRDGVWYPVVGEAWWDEYAPLREERALDACGPEQAARRFVLEPNWARMGRVLIAKCAEAQALRRGWPNLLSGLYGEEELQALKNDKTATERIGDTLARTPHRGGGQTAWFVFDPDQGMTGVPREQIATRVAAFVNQADAPEAISTFLERNRLSLALFWEWEPAAAIEVKLYIERRKAELEACSRESAARGAKRSRTRTARNERRRARGASTKTEQAHEDAPSPET